MAGLGHRSGGGRTVKTTDGRRLRKVFDAEGRPVEIARPKRAAPSWLSERNAVVHAVAAQRNISVPEASRAVRLEGLWTR